MRSLKGISRNLKYKRHMRKNPTHPEKIMWQLLKNKALAGLKFRRQHGIGPYIADFYYSPQHLVIEIDGAGHETPQQKAYDTKRTNFLTSLGYKILRFKNAEVLQASSDVLQTILRICTPPPVREGERGRTSTPNTTRGS